MQLISGRGTWGEFRTLTSPGIIHCVGGWSTEHPERPAGKRWQRESDRRSRQKDKAEACRDEDGDVKWGPERQEAGLRHRKRYRGWQGLKRWVVKRWKVNRSQGGVKGERLKGETWNDWEKEDRLESQYHLLPGGSKCCFKSLDGVKRELWIRNRIRWIMKARKSLW